MDTGTLLHIARLEADGLRRSGHVVDHIRQVLNRMERLEYSHTLDPQTMSMDEHRDAYLRSVRSRIGQVMGVELLKHVPPQQIEGEMVSRASLLRAVVYYISPKAD